MPCSSSFCFLASIFNWSSPGHIDSVAKSKMYYFNVNSQEWCTLGLVYKVLSKDQSVFVYKSYFSCCWGNRQFSQDSWVSAKSADAQSKLVLSNQLSLSTRFFETEKILSKKISWYWEFSCSVLATFGQFCWAGGLAAAEEVISIEYLLCQS